jgi:soluble lytic murein transglycosylase
MMQDHRVKWLSWPLVASTLLITVQARTDNPPPQQEGSAAAVNSPLESRITPTAHPAVPPQLQSMWYAPDEDAPAPAAVVANLARGVQLLDESGDPAQALALVNNPAFAKTPVADYARYYTGIALQRMNRLDEADAAFAAVADRKVDAQLPESALYRRAEIREAKLDFAAAVDIYDQLLKRTPASPQIALVKLGADASAAGDRQRAIAAHRRVLQEFTLTAEAAEAERLLDQLGGFTLDTPEAIAAELGRGEALFKARKYDLAKNAYTRIASRLLGEDRERTTLRLAQIQAATGQPRQARDVFQRFATHPTLGAEAQFGLLSERRATGHHDEANDLTEDFVARHPNHPLAEEALHEMARRYVLDDDDETAAKVYTRMIDRFPAGPFAERGAWKAGWWAYREKNFAETIRVFERGAATFPRSDYRPSWLYWTARAYDQMGERLKAVERYRLTATDYLNTYYGRLAWKRLEEHNEATVTPGIRRAVAAPTPPPPNAEIVKTLITAGLYRPALNELQYAQKVWGDSPQVQATIALVHNKMGNLRLGITAMKRAYPQFMTAGGEELPQEILRIIYPIDYWPLLKGNAQAQGLDPYIVAALAAQESTFDPQIKSSANAIGLMQLITPTGRRIARKIGMRNFSERSLSNPEINARLGTQYFGDMVKEFGGYHFALAGYNAGEHRVRRWNSEAPGLPVDEWIDNIPFPETQNYVKRILGTAEDYRRLYGEGQIPTAVTRKSTPTKKAAAPTKKAPTKKAPAKKAATKKAPVKKGG